MGDPVMIFDFRDFHIEVTREGQYLNARFDKVHAYKTHRIRKTNGITVPASVASSQEDEHGKGSPAQHQRCGGSWRKGRCRRLSVRWGWRGRGSGCLYRRRQVKLIYASAGKHPRQEKRNTKHQLDSPEAIRRFAVYMLHRGYP